MKKVIRPCTVPLHDRRNTKAPVYCAIEFESGKLSITGVVGPLHNGDARGKCGQIVSEFAHRDPAANDARTHSPIEPKNMEFAAGWSADLWLDFVDVWEAWHLNDMQAGCEHQRAAGWNKRPIDATKPTTAYGKHFPGQRQDSWNMLTWVSRSEHPEGLLSFPCPVCGYKYGTAWLKMDVPQTVIDFLQSLPDADMTPAWV